MDNLHSIRTYVQDCENGARSADMDDFLTEVMTAINTGNLCCPDCLKKKRPEVWHDLKALTARMKELTIS